MTGAAKTTWTSWAALDEVSSRPYVDADRLGVTGYSYGGFMSSWIIGHDTRFNAAVVGAPCINLSSMYGTSDIGVIFGEPQWGGMRKDALDVFLERSPLTYAPNVETPVLLMHGEDDARCPIEQSEQYFVALKRLGKEVELVRFPGVVTLAASQWTPTDARGIPHSLPGVVRHPPGDPESRNRPEPRPCPRKADILCGSNGGDTLPWTAAEEER